MTTFVVATTSSSDRNTSSKVSSVKPVKPSAGTRAHSTLHSLPQPLCQARIILADLIQNSIAELNQRPLEAIVDHGAQMGMNQH